MYKKPLPSLAELQHHFNYDPKTGDLMWKNPTFHTCAKGVIGPTGTNHGYRVVGLKGEIYLQHRIIWKMMTGVDPDQDMTLDHIDEDQGNNRWDNLQQVSLSENQTRSSKHIRAPRLEVWQQRTGRWTVRRIRPYTGGIHNEYLGTFDTREEALAVPINAIFEKPPPKMQVRKTRYGTWEARVWDRTLKKKVHVGTFHSRELALAAKYEP